MLSQKQIAIITTGGTISSVSTAEGIKPQEGVIEDVLERLGYSRNGDSFVSNNGRVKLDIFKLFNKDSTDIVVEDRMTIARKAMELMKTYDGLVITHGTDSLEQTSYDLSLWLQHPTKTVALTGSFKISGEDKSDALGNLKEAITFACEGVCGVFVVFHGTVLEGCWAYEHIVPYMIENEAIRTFRSIRGEVAFFNDSGVFFTKGRPESRPQEQEPRLELKYNKNIVHISPPITIALLEDSAKNADGIIINATASSGVPKQILPVLKGIAKEKPVLSTPNYYIMSTDLYATANNLRKNGVTPGTPLPKFDREAFAFVLGVLERKPIDPKIVRDRFNCIVEENIRRSSLYRIQKEYAPSFRINHGKVDSGLCVAAQGAVRKPTPKTSDKKLKLG